LKIPSFQLYFQILKSSNYINVKKRLLRNTEVAKGAGADEIKSLPEGGYAIPPDRNPGDKAAKRNLGSC
jgi:hypothetical protein